MPSRFCLQPGCRTIYDAATGADRCPPHQAAATQRQRARTAARRPSASQRGYDAQYRRNRAIVVAQALAAADAGTPMPCARPHCGQPCLRGQKITAEHLIAIRNGGTGELANLAPAHSACNTAWNRGMRS